MKSHRHLVYMCMLWPLVVIGPIGCNHTAPPPNHIRAAKLGPPQSNHLQRIDSLTRALLGLGNGTGPTEAEQVAKTSVTYSAELARHYRTVRPPELHNILVRLGLKKRGLCYHWADDLLARLEKLDLVNLHLQRAVTHQGSDLYEHHSVVVTSSKGTFEEGIVLDPWRSSGELFWAPVSEDRHPWVPLNAQAPSKNGKSAR